MDDHCLSLHLSGRCVYDDRFLLHLPWRRVHDHGLRPGRWCMNDYSFRPGRGRMHDDRFPWCVDMDMTRRCVDDSGWRMNHHGRRSINDDDWSVNDDWFVNHHWWDNYPRRMDHGSMNHHRWPRKVYDRSSTMMTMDDTSGADDRERRRATAQTNKSKHFHRVFSFAAPIVDIRASFRDTLAARIRQHRRLSTTDATNRRSGETLGFWATCPDT